ncbi:hypothetical protein Scep_030726 [Stephania cephalantha]|uniref:Uncharacterized protein n=1 Tax=Stephania cephalantha TaxID=152367 RepID=A0AAP0HIV9_9MAGN
MAERPLEQPHSLDQQMHSLTAKEDMISCVMALEAALLPCLPARELQAIDRSPHPSHQIDVERHARDFMEAAKKLQLYFISLHATRRCQLRKKTFERDCDDGRRVESQERVDYEARETTTGMEKTGERLVG